MIERDRVTVFEGVPTMYVGLLGAGAGAADTSSLRLCVSGGAALPVEVLHGFEKAFGAVILEGYGLSETSPVATFNRRDRRKPGSIGLPIEGVELRLVSVDERRRPRAAGEVGEIAIRGHNVMKGYWKRPEATAAAIRGGWFHTGDLARVDEDGFYYIVDRKKELIIRGGYNVYPREIEEVLYEHPAVARGRGDRHPAPLARRGGRRRRHAAARRGGDPGGAARLREGAGRRVQVPAARVAGRRAAEGRHRQDPQARDRDPGGRLAGQAARS